MDYEEFQNAVDSLGILTKLDQKSLKKNYLKLSKKYHPDAVDGSDEKFREINEAYNLLKTYVENYKFSFEKEEFLEQYPSFTNYKNWNR
ncbi:MAG: molecular chaperone DnaJ [Arcobacter sp.]|jgi:DnaJ-class molecular chaperone|uniref:DnaJ domain-containing protein n=1 Tax=uncultured Arcobacter sp. TaxID=165434 RepID=UPI000CBF448F|nr:DnaJ domain-containing protein [uncultured Arcobacter sp.]PLY09088.1 MAG: molecular chaperone DnaJ [Arcobacter sp.]